ncbi:hypothetical protein [Gordonia sp. GAMMA]|uniref:hypothetical protein n=1 Tax=Gordonia sp. GAMMA TaxID=2502241 RepID=UPI0010F96588|nr:hypothetical protein [Gordonia sp. GAMMA]
MASPQLALSHYVHDLTEAAATRLISTENLHRENGESATEAFLWAINGGGLFSLEQALILLVDQALTVHEEQRSQSEAVDSIRRVADEPSLSGLLTNDLSATYSEDVLFADWLPTGSDEEDRILSLLSLEPS